MARKYLEGLDQVQKLFDRAPPKMAEAITRALNRSALEIEQDARTLAPYAEIRSALETRQSLDGLRLTGALARLSGRRSRNGSAIDRFVGVFPESRESLAWWAAFVEFGTAAGPRTYRRGPKRGTVMQHPGTDAKPFLVPAFVANRTRVERRISRAISKAARELVRGPAR